MTSEPKRRRASQGRAAAPGPKRSPRSSPPVTAAAGRAKITCATLGELKRAGTPIVMATAYDYPFARLADAAGIDVLLVGDSLGMVVLGYDSTLPVTLQHVLHHARAVTRARPHALVVADMPFMSFQVSPRQALRNAGRLVQEARVEAVKLEGGERVLPMVEAIARADIPVMGHLGLTPQSVHRIGGYRVQGRTAEAAARLQREARALQDAGCFALVLEAIPAALARQVTAAVSIPTIGIGAGAGCDGQVLVLHDILGLYAEHVPKFVRRFADLGAATRQALEAYALAVRAGDFPATEHTYD